MMKTIKTKLFYFLISLSAGLVGCLESEEVVQPINVTSLELIAGGITNGQGSTFGSSVSTNFETDLSNFGLLISVDDWQAAGDEVEGANTHVSVNEIIEFSITSDSTILVTQDSVYAPGEDLSDLFMTDRVGSSSFEPRFTMDRMIGSNLEFDPVIMQMVCTLERNLNQSFTIEITMDDGQEFSIQSNRVRVSR